MASKSVARALGCAGSLRNWAFKIVSLGLSRATTRVVALPGAIPIQIDSMMLVLARRLGRHDDGGALRGGNDRLRGNFSATHVRFYFSPPLTPPVRAYRGLPLRRMRPPMLAFPLTTT